MAGATQSADRPSYSIQGLASQANPAFAVGAVAVPILALAAAMMAGDLRLLLYVHVMAGILWTGIDVFMGMVLGPVLGGMDPEKRADFFSTFTPKMTFLMPTLALVTISGGITMAMELNLFPHAAAWLALMTAATLVPVVALIGWQFDAFGDRRWQVAAALALVVSVGALALTLPDFGMTQHWVAGAIVVVTLLSINGFGLVMPGEVRIYRQLVSENPDTDVISDIGMRNAKLGGLQGAMQLTIIAMMVGIRGLAL
jgi:hypothetical protein